MGQGSSVAVAVAQASRRSSDFILAQELPYAAGEAVKKKKKKNVSKYWFLVALLHVKEMTRTYYIAEGNLLNTVE